TTDRERADSLFDLSVAHHHARRFEAAERELAEALALYARLGESERHLSALGNRADLHLACGRFAAARADVERVAAHDRAPGREYAFLFSCATVQQLALLAVADSA